MSKITVESAAKLIGCHQQYVRKMMDTGEWDIGVVIRNPQKNRYIVFEDKLNRFVGKKE